ncbi:LuxR C-terminal-related transcriptional regulator [Micromonospora sp. NPDC051196]|uniref:LuxR C-terminal-related transcriptional regulator n=1 Tax=Micromonospora sp. NPDC051196 TaxID=3155281 RepID=UPI00343D9FAC
MGSTEIAIRDRLRDVFAGRHSELRRIAAATDRRGSAGIALIGAEGVGKSRLQAEATNRADPTRHRVIRAVTTVATANVPFGALAEHLPSGLLRSPFTGDALRGAAEALLKPAGKRRLTLVVDDTQLLDEASAALAVQLARRGELFLLTALRPDRRLPRPIGDLWTDGLAEWVEVGPLSRDDVHQVLGEALGGQVEGVLVQRFWEATAGNALLVRELLTAQLEANRLVADDGMWTLRGPFAIPSWLAGLVDERLVAAPPECRAALELLAVTEPICPGVLAELVPADVLEAAEARGLIRIERTNGQELARLTYPMYGEVLRAVTPRLRARRWLSQCASIVEATSQNPVDLARAVSWRLACGQRPSPENMAIAARAACSAMDFELAGQLATAESVAGRAAAVIEPLGYGFLFTGRSAEAESALSGLGRLDHEVDRARVASVRAFNLYFGLDRQAPAEALLAATVDATVDPATRRRLVARQALLRALSDAPQDALELAAGVPDEPEARVAAGLAQVFSGRPHEGLDLLSGGWPDDAPWLPILADLGTVHGLLWTGQFVAAEERSGTGYDRALANRWQFGILVSCLQRGLAARMRGQLRDQITWCREGISIAREQGSNGMLAVLLGLLAHGYALTGKTDAAAHALAEADRLAGVSLRLLGPWTELSRAWVIAARRGDAAAHAQRTARLARDRGAAGFEALALHDAVRLGAPKHAADRLRALAGQSDRCLGHLYATHARAKAEGDAAALAGVSADFAELGSPLLAAEAAAEEAERHRSDGRLAMASTAAARALMFMRHCEEVPRSPALSALATPRLTPREGEIAELAARGLSSREIGRNLVLSVRTVENHLHRVYRKLGINTRGELDALRVLLTVPQG